MRERERVRHGDRDDGGTCDAIIALPGNAVRARGPAGERARVRFLRRRRRRTRKRVLPARLENVVLVRRRSSFDIEHCDRFVMDANHVPEGLPKVRARRRLTEKRVRRTHVRGAFNG